MPIGVCDVSVTGILCVQFDDNRIVSGSSDKSIKVLAISVKSVKI